MRVRAHMRWAWPLPAPISRTVEALQTREHVCRFIRIQEAKTAAFSHLEANVHQCGEPHTPAPVCHRK